MKGDFSYSGLTCTDIDIIGTLSPCSLYLVCLNDLSSNDMVHFRHRPSMSLFWLTDVFDSFQLWQLRKWRGVDTVLDVQLSDFEVDRVLLGNLQNLSPIDAHTCRTISLIDYIRSITVLPHSCHRPFRGQVEAMVSCYVTDHPSKPEKKVFWEHREDDVNPTFQQIM